MADDSSGLSERELHFSYWYTTNKLTLKRIFTFIFAVVVGVMWAFALFQVADWAVIRGMTERRLTNAMVQGKVNYRAFHERNVPRNLEILSTQALADGVGKVDLVAILRNPNAQWSAEITYQFAQGAGETVVQESFVLPGDEKAITSYAFAGSSETPDLKILSLHWLKVPPHEIKQFDTWAAERLNFEIDKVGNSLVDFGAKKITRTSFTIRNGSAYGYWSLPLQVKLVRPGGDIAAIQEVVLDRFTSGDVRTVDVNWFYDVPANAAPQITPSVNLLDKSVYIPLRGE